MPYAVWLDLAAPESAAHDQVALAQLPKLIGDLVEAGWEVTPPALDSGEDTEADVEEGGPPDLLDVRVLAHPDGAVIGLAVDTNTIQIALAVGTSLACHVSNAAPALLGWTLQAVRAHPLTGLDEDGDWLPPLRDDRGTSADHGLRRAHRAVARRSAQCSRTNSQAGTVDGGRVVSSPQPVARPLCRVPGIVGWRRLRAGLPRSADVRQAR